jgi:acid stress-induced BolA-like protein IbaG/YrbA
VNSETHFKVVIVSEQFASAKSPVQRHRMVNTALSHQLEGPVHALSIVTKSPEQWQSMLDQGKTIEPSPKCRGGDGSLPRKTSG